MLTPQTLQQLGCNFIRIKDNKTTGVQEWENQ